MARAEGYAAVVRQRMVARLEERGISARTLAAFAAVPRHLLVRRFWTAPPPGTDRATPTAELRVDGGDRLALDVLHDVDRAVAVNVVPEAPGRATSTGSAPGLLAAQADQLAMEEGMAVLEIGTGAGYFAAVLAELVGPTGRVVSIDVDREVAAAAVTRLRGAGYGRVTVVVADGDAGAPDHAPFDRVVASVGCTDVAAAWLAQLTPSGRALVPLLHGCTHPMVEIAPDGTGRAVMRSGYVAIQGRQAASLPWPHALAAVEPVDGKPLPDDLRTTFAVEPGRELLFGLREWDLAFWIALTDHRAGFLASLNDGAGSSASLDAARGALRWGGPHGRELADELRGHLDRWVAAGSPAIESFHHRFVARGTATGPTPGGAGAWVIQRIDHDQVVTA